MMRIRDLKVWFPLRRGLMRELIGGSAMWVRAVDGVSFDVKRGEVFCLVGESGCGKTTTGKALLRLVDATGGDVLFEMPTSEYGRYENLRSQAKTPETTEQVNGLRRKYSFSWKEEVPWTAVQVLLLTALMGAGIVASLFAPALLAGLLQSPFTNSGILIGLCILSGGLLGLIAAAPPTRPSKRTPAVAALAAILTYNFIPLVTAWLLPAAVPERVSDAVGTVAAVWGESLFAMLIGVLFAGAVAGGVARTVLSIRADREGLRGIKMRTLRRRLHLIFQDPYESLNPKQSVFEIVSEPLTVNRVSRDPQEIAALVSRSLEDAGLRPAEEFMFRFPHELSGGQRQRVSIAAALALEPDFIVADEPVSMLDVSIRTEILDLMMELRKRRGITYLFITHDLGLAWILADRIAVMYLGKIVEEGTAEQVIGHPKHPYTQALISVVPSPDPRHLAHRTILKGERPDPVNIPTGCRFHPRCPVAFERCGWNAEEVADEIQEAQSEIAARLGAAAAEKEGRVRGLRDRAKKEPGEASSLEAEAATMEKDAQNLRASQQRAEAIRAAVQVQDPHHVFLAPSSGLTSSALQESLAGLVRAQKDTRLAFRGVVKVAEGSGGVVVSLHDWSEPPLLEIESGNTVACHLITPQAEAAPTPAAVPA